MLFIQRFTVEEALSGAAPAEGFDAAGVLRGVAGGAPKARLNARQSEMRLREIKRRSESTTVPV